MSTPTFESKVPFSTYVQIAFYLLFFGWYARHVPFLLLPLVIILVVIAGTTCTLLLRDDRLYIRTFFNQKIKTSVPLSAITQVQLVRAPRRPLELTFKIPGTARISTVMLHAHVSRMPSVELKALIGYLESKGIPVKIQPGLTI